VRVGYRLRQVAIRAVTRREPLGSGLVASVLPPKGLALFGRMSTGDQRHALCVLDALRAGETCRRELAEAALLHDVGKADSGLTMAHRSVAVILGALCPRALERLACPEPRSWRYAFYVHLHHGEIGAEQCAAIGCDPLTVYLVRHHDGRARAAAAPADWQVALEALRCADERC